MYGKRYTEIEEFYSTCSTFLKEHEAENNLIWGILKTLRTNIHAYDPERTPELVAVFENEEVVLVSIRTPPYNQIVSYTDKKEAIPVLVDFLAKRGEDIPGVLGFKEGALLFAEEWTKRFEKTFVLNMNERIYKLEHVNPDIKGTNQFEIASEGNLDLLIQYAQQFVEDAFANTTPEQIERGKIQMKKSIEQRIAEKKVYVLKVQNQIVSLAGATRETPNGRTITLVYTPPEFRRKGYATELVAKLCQSILEEGNKFCTLFTDLANPTSNKIYMNIGYQPIIDVDEYRFE
ncbi:MAG: GNAT family N-acetyltransferase [Candidatus Hodarchaeales archaeon]|jgi:RimJ/RimL family protein N-acetyltransferase